MIIIVKFHVYVLNKSQWLL